LHDCKPPTNVRLTHPEFGVKARDSCDCAVDFRKLTDSELPGSPAYSCVTKAVD
jgi:hypothetical protein